MQELVERTGRNPQVTSLLFKPHPQIDPLTLPVVMQYEYLQLGCSKNAAARMLGYARRNVGKPFSNVGMARSLFWPRQTDSSSFFCAGRLRATLTFHLWY